MYLSVIIPTYNRNEMLRKCLALLSPEMQTLDKRYYEVIVSDDSKEHLASVLRSEFPWANIVEGPKRGPASNRNHGAKLGKGEWLVFIDDDCLPGKDLLKTYYNEIALEEYKAFEGYINAERPQNRYDEDSPLNLNGNCFWTCNVAVEKALFESLNGFDEGFPFPAMEDVDLYNRITNVANCKFLPEAQVIHPWRRVLPFRNFKERIMSNNYYLKKNNIKKDFNYKFKRLKLFIGQSMSDFTTLFKYSFKGFLVYIDKLCFNFIMIFI